MYPSMIFNSDQKKRWLMKFSQFPKLSSMVISFVFVVFLFIAGCSDQQTSGKNEQAASSPDEAVKIVYVDWASERASANVVKAAIEQEMNRDCKIRAVSLVAMWQALAKGDQDGMVAAWLPSLQERFLEKHKQDVVNLGPNLKGTKIGIVVPGYVDINSIEELKDHAPKFDHKIIGIDPHAGIMEKTEKAIEVYNLKDFELISGSGATMTTTLQNAIQEKRWIAVTGWTPHWKFAKWDLKYLEDPRNVFGEEEYIATFVRQGLKEDKPEVYKFLDNFYWKTGDMEQVMLWAQDEDTSYQEAARRWVDKNREKVETWINN